MFISLNDFRFLIINVSMCRQVYDWALETMLFDIGLDARGITATSDWKFDSKLLRTALRNLYGICIHPQVRISCYLGISVADWFPLQVGQLQGENDGYKPNVLKTMDTVLQVC